MNSEIFEQRATVVIPVWRVGMTASEIAAFVQGLKILGKHPISLVAPENLDLGLYEELSAQVGRNFPATFSGALEIQRFPERYFAGIEGYGRMCLATEFYERFAAYDWMLIYQLDAWVFRDELPLWCALEFDFFGAPLFQGFAFGNAEAPVIDGLGNGGFSLRRIAAFLRVLPRVYADPAAREYLESRPAMEDLCIGQVFPKFDPQFKIAPPEISGNFSFEMYPRKLFQLTSQRLPFGCHKFSAYDPGFWREFIRDDFNENLTRFNFPASWA